MSMFQGDPGPITAWIAFAISGLLEWLGIIKPREMTDAEKAEYRKTMEEKGFHFEDDKVS